MPRRPGEREEEFRTAKALLRSIGWKGPHGLKERKINSWLRHFYRSHGLGAYFDLRKLASDCDLIFYARNRAGDRREILDPVVRHYVQRMRDAVVAFVEYFWQLPQHQKYVNDGLSDEEIFHKVIDFMVNSDVYPVWSDRYDQERKWKLMDLDAYGWLRQMRANALVSEAKDKGRQMKVMMRRFERSLPGKFQAPSLPRDTFIKPPALGPGEGVPCHVEGCGLRFPDTAAWLRHARNRHPNIPEIRERDDEPATGLDALFDGI
jgi:hypothetical protein